MSANHETFQLVISSNVIQASGNWQTDLVKKKSHVSTINGTANCLLDANSHSCAFVRDRTKSQERRTKNNCSHSHAHTHAESHVKWLHWQWQSQPEYRSLQIKESLLSDWTKALLILPRANLASFVSGLFFDGTKRCYSHAHKRRT